MSPSEPAVVPDGGNHLALTRDQATALMAAYRLLGQIASTCAPLAEQEGPALPSVPNGILVELPNRDDAGVPGAEPAP